MRLDDVIWDYRALRTGAPLGQFRPARPDDVHPTCCAYQASGRACRHGVIARPGARPAIKSNWPTDPHQTRQLLADLDRQIERLPGLARDLFDLVFRRYDFWVPMHQERNGEQLGPGTPGHVDLHAIKRKLRFRTMRDMMRLLNYHLRAIEMELLDWFPAARAQEGQAA